MSHWVLSSLVEFESMLHTCVPVYRFGVVPDLSESNSLLMFFTQYPIMLIEYWLYSKLSALPHLIFRTTLLGKYYYYSHFLGEELGDYKVILPTAI